MTSSLRVKHPYTLSLAVGIGAVAGLRPMTAPAVIAWAARRKWIHLGSSPFVTIISARASRTITELAISELIADKLPFTPSRLNPGPLASRIASGAVCGAAVCGAVKRPFVEGALLGGLGAIAGVRGWASGGRLSNRRRRGHNRTDGECQIAPFISGGE